MSKFKINSELTILSLSLCIIWSKSAAAIDLSRFHSHNEVKRAGEWFAEMSNKNAPYLNIYAPIHRSIYMHFVLIIITSNYCCCLTINFLFFKLN